MKLRKAKQICRAINYNHGKKLNWSAGTIQKMNKHRIKHNAKERRKSKQRKKWKSLAHLIGNEYAKRQDFAWLSAILIDAK